MADCRPRWRKENLIYCPVLVDHYRELKGDLRVCDKTYGEIGAAVNGLPGVDVRIYTSSNPLRTQVRLYSTTVDLSDGSDAGIQYGGRAATGGSVTWSITENDSSCLQEGICSL